PTRRSCLATACAAAWRRAQYAPAPTWTRSCVRAAGGKRRRSAAISKRPTHSPRTRQGSCYEITVPRRDERAVLLPGGDMKKLMLAMAMAAVLTGCGGEPTIDATSEEALRKSIVEVSLPLSEDDRSRLAN